MEILLQLIIKTLNTGVMVLVSLGYIEVVVLWSNAYLLHIKSLKRHRNNISILQRRH